MKTQSGKPSILATGLAMFAMFFGAGNVVFPLALGQVSMDQNFWGIIGMTLTAVLVPLMGTMAMLLFDGDYNKFFQRVGKLPGFFLVALILAVIGPFGGVPRCITISYATLAPFLGGIPGVNLVTFSALNAILIFIFTVRPGKILNVIGKFLTPVLLLSLAVIVFKGIFGIPHAGESGLTRWETFSTGFLSGYNTMDLLATFFFSSVVLLCLRDGVKDGNKTKLMKVAGIGGLIAASLLTAIYVSFSYLAAAYSAKLGGVQGHEMLGALARQLLGPYAGLIVAITVFFACLTTEIALAAVASRFLSENVTRNRLPYAAALGAVLFVSFLVSTLNFTGIAAFLTPILQLCYPALIALALVNIVYKVWRFQPVKLIFYGTLLATLAVKLF
ncbi:MAG: Branched-chain amino acid transport system 2 carrier protein [Chlamydiales bacterium]|nr:Branched-chain amino acid transport system 2 carrier protein [Chlamydiales bacterium]MCH9636263.1 Branched-chain amino acid transport system 2 carrier protein [Chlamydiales bacterium]MCH9704190.1 branched-chain amino acid transport system II carrier protein [Chlamydiota bacterium]